MKKIVITTLISACISSTVFASAMISPITCPTTFPNLPLVRVAKSLPGYYVVQSRQNTHSLAAFVIKADTPAAAKILANAIVASGLTPVWNQAKIWTQDKNSTMYYCPYSSSQYQLSTENLNQLKQNPQEAADYMILKAKG